MVPTHDSSFDDRRLFRRRLRYRITTLPILLLTASVLQRLDTHAFASGHDRRPNIVFILADDLGWSDLGCYGNSLFETPHLDRLAQQSLRLTQAYAPAPICSASRAAILTGKTPARLGFEFVTKNAPGYQPVDAPLRAPPFTLNLPLDEVTIPEVLHTVGYETAFFGKWHLNQHHGGYLGWSPTHGPKSQGFDVAEEDFGCHPYSYWSKKKQRAFQELPDGQFPVDSMTARAERFLQSPHEKPFFLMVSHFYVHTPVHTRVRWLYDRYLDKIDAANPQREKLAHYGAMVSTLDHFVGQLLQTLDETGLAESTLVVFTSDNGGHPEYAGNAPLRGSKWNLYEGGIRVPFLVRWPDRIQPGTTSDAIVSAIDLLPTFADLTDAKSPKDIDGRSLRAVLSGDDSLDSERTALWHFPYYHPERGFSEAPSEIGIHDGVTSQTRPHSVWRAGPWKLIHFYEDQRNELYHLPTDLSEQHNRSQSDPEVTRRLRRQLEAALQKSNARLPTVSPE